LLFTPAEIREQLSGKVVTRKSGKPLPVRPSPFLRAAIMLGINAGLGNTDVAELPLSVLDLDGGWLDYARGKTGAERRAWLWPETVAAVRAYLAVRAKPHRPEFGKLAFLTTAGRPYVVRRKGRRQQDKIGERYGRLLRSLGQRQGGRNFYTLRRCFRTYAAETGQERAIDLVMGHAEKAGDMGAVYGLAVSDEVVKAVCLHVRSRVLSVSAESPSPTP
jgi:integrase